MTDRPASGWHWQDKAAGGGLMDVAHPVRRSGVSSHDVRFIGFTDLLLFARGASVMDVGCNRGHNAYEFYRDGARLVHGCDIDGPSIHAARHWFAELTVESKFEVVDLTGGPKALSNAFGAGGYDIVLFVGVQHKLKRSMQPQQLSELITHLGQWTLKHLGWNGHQENLEQMDSALKLSGLRRIHTSEFAHPGIAAVWKRD